MDAQGGNRSNTRPNTRNGKKNKGKDKKPSNSNRENFKGDCDDLKGKIFFIGSSKQADNYNNTVEAILEYFLRSYTHGLDLVESLEALKEKDFQGEVPIAMTADPNASEEEKTAIKEAHREEMKQFISRKSMLKTNLVKAYGIIWGQCTKGLRAKLESRKDWNDGTDGKIKYKPINLLKAIKEITHNYQDNKYPMESMYYCLRTLFVMKQEENEGLNDFTKRFNNAVDIMETTHGPLPMTAYLRTREDYTNASNQEEKTKVVSTQYNRFKAFIYLKALDGKRSSKLVEDLGNQYALGTDQFPTTVTRATEAVVAYKNRVKQQSSN